MFYTNIADGPSMDIQHGLTLQRINCRCSLFSQDDQGTQAKGVMYMYCLYKDYKNEREYFCSTNSPPLDAKYFMPNYIYWTNYGETCFLEDKEEEDDNPIMHYAQYSFFADVVVGS